MAVVLVPPFPDAILDVPASRPMLVMLSLAEKLNAAEARIAELEAKLAAGPSS